MPSEAPDNLNLLLAQPLRSAPGYDDAFEEVPTAPARKGSGPISESNAARPLRRTQGALLALESEFGDTVARHAQPNEAPPVVPGCAAKKW